MMKHLIALVFLLLGVVFVSGAQVSLSKLSWLIGTWETKTPKRMLYEQWTKKTDHEFFAKSYFLKGRDTVMLESIRLIESAGSLSYVPVVSGENGGLPVEFKLSSFSADRAAFENLQHDFPQHIIYTRLSADAMEAETSGTENGKTKSVKFPMTRIK